MPFEPFDMGGRDAWGTVMCGREMGTISVGSGYAFVAVWTVVIDFEQGIFHIQTKLAPQAVPVVTGRTDTLQNFVREYLMDKTEEGRRRGWDRCHPVVMSDSYTHPHERMHEDLCDYNGYIDTPHGFAALLHDAWITTFEGVPVSGVEPEPAKGRAKKR